CQNLYLACESTNLGTCAILSYDQKRIDRLLSLDGQEEFIIYVASVGKVKS
ncbi:MAG: nitroreductase family protein, partial [Candidatus Hodarchaeales archaeon]